MKKFLAGAAMATALLASAGAHAALVNVGGVVWDTEAAAILPQEGDFLAHGGIYETAFTLGDTSSYSVTGRGLIERINYTATNLDSYCPSGCELTYTFSMVLSSVTSLGGDTAAFSFSDLVIQVWLGSAANYDGSVASASDGILWLELTARDLLTGFGTGIGTGSDTGLGSAYLDVTGGLAAAYFDTNTKLGGTDMVFSSSFQPAGFSENGVAILTGTFDLKGDSVQAVPEPASLALVGLGLVGLAGVRRRRQPGAR